MEWGRIDERSGMEDRFVRDGAWALGDGSRADGGSGVATRVSPREFEEGKGSWPDGRFGK